MAVTRVKNVWVRLASLKEQKNRSPRSVDGGEGQRRTVEIADDQDNFARPHLAIKRQDRFSDLRHLAGIQRVDEAPCYLHFTNLLTGEFGYARFDLPLKQCFRRFDVDAGESQICRAQVEHQPRIRVYFRARFHGDRHRLGRRSNRVRGMQARSRERHRRRPLVVQRKAEPGPNAGRKAHREFARPTLAKDRNPIGDRSEALSILRTFDAHRLDELALRCLQRHGVDGNVSPGFDVEYRGRAAQRRLERFGGTDRRRLRRWTLDQERQFITARISKAQILQ